jgi:hypothetical protein
MSGSQNPRRESSERLISLDRATASEACHELFLDLRHVDVLGERG